MAEEKSLEEVAAELKQIDGNVKAEVILVQRDYILYKEGEEGLKRLEEKMDGLGADLSFEKIKASSWEKEWKNSLMTVVAKEIFNWKEEDIFEMGRYSPRASFFIKMMMQYVVSLDVLFNSANIYWKKQQDFGEVESVELNKEERYSVVRIKNFHTHPLLCIYHAGYFKGALEFVTKSKGVTVEEVECTHRGGRYHEYLIKW
jgi:predicted hydrocarbon binding protein